ncbi:hypothetical protein N7478_009240 [Penicillium angulare]|uniref:uncharacterized protein n=1 Tax=Penicillium angulare TaxID=116970 RepID=UPI002540E69E|nr:uncharacterized protein N7478_009240 [Penicillium angulare]KAJ5274115.1 hypothetical protein N7478_009240 [Penicillium angulare]
MTVLVVDFINDAASRAVRTQTQLQEDRANVGLTTTHKDPVSKPCFILNIVKDYEVMVTIKCVVVSVLDGAYDRAEGGFR